MRACQMKKKSTSGKEDSEGIPVKEGQVRINRVNDLPYYVISIDEPNNLVTTRYVHRKDTHNWWYNAVYLDAVDPGYEARKQFDKDLEKLLYGK